MGMCSKRTIIKARRNFSLMHFSSATINGRGLSLRVHHMCLAKQHSSLVCKHDCRCASSLIAVPCGRGSLHVRCGIGDGSTSRSTLFSCHLDRKDREKR